MHSQCCATITFILFQNSSKPFMTCGKLYPLNSHHSSPPPASGISICTLFVGLPPILDLSHSGIIWDVSAFCFWLLHLLTSCFEIHPCCNICQYSLLLWLNNIPFVYIQWFDYLFTAYRHLGCFQLGFCKQYCMNMHVYVLVLILLDTYLGENYSDSYSN